MQCKEVEVVLEHEGWTPLPEAAREHVAGCAACQNLVEDLTAIVATAHLFPPKSNPLLMFGLHYVPNWKKRESSSRRPPSAVRGCRASRICSAAACWPPLPWVCW